MNDLQKLEQEKNVLRWGGLAGILGGIILILVFVIVGVFAGVDPANSEGQVMRFPDIRAARTVENGLYLVVLTCGSPTSSPCIVLSGGRGSRPLSSGAYLALLVSACSRLEHSRMSLPLPISDLYHAPGATPEDQATLVLLWQATEGIFDALLFAGLAIVAVGLTALGVAMLGTPAFGKGCWLVERGDRGSGGHSGDCSADRS